MAWSIVFGVELALSISKVCFSNGFSVHRSIKVVKEEVEQESMGTRVPA